MSLRIKAIESGSLAAENGIEAGDKILSINGMGIRDFLDLELYATDFKLDLVIEDSAGARREQVIYRETARPLGIIPQDYRHKRCQNNCIFCFIDQMPPNLRKTLYVKDDDYIFSYVFGNYITLTNLVEDEIERILDQRISPLYISLHSSNTDLRQRMMRSAGPVDAMAIIRRLAEGDISFHIQIVLVPGFNDKEELRKTLNDLVDPSLSILSIGIVPVGLTRYRDGLCSLEGFDEDSAGEALDLIDECRASLSSEIIYPADEFYVLANRPVPQPEFYHDFPQLENGIGMISRGYENFCMNKEALLNKLAELGGDFRLLGSQSAEGHLRQITSELNRGLKDQKVRLQLIRNDFFGGRVTVSGLLTFADISAQVQADEKETLILPDAIFNQDGMSLDGRSLDELKEATGRDILVVDQLWSD